MCQRLPGYLNQKISINGVQGYSMLNPWMKGTFNCQSTAQWKVGREDRYCNGKWHSAGSFAKRPFNLHWILCPTWNTEVSCSLQMKRLLLLSESHQTKWWCTQIHRSIALFWCQRNLFEERLQPTTTQSSFWALFLLGINQQMDTSPFLSAVVFRVCAYYTTKQSKGWRCYGDMD